MWYYYKGEVLPTVLRPELTCSQAVFEARKSIDWREQTGNETDQCQLRRGIESSLERSNRRRFIVKVEEISKNERVT